MYFDEKCCLEETEMTDALSEHVSALVDFNSIKCAPRRKTLVLLNHFVVSSVSFLNHFHTATDKKLRLISRNLSRLEIKLSILEAKLKSIEGSDGVRQSTVPTASLPSVPDTQPGNQDPTSTPSSIEKIENNKNSTAIVPTVAGDSIEGTVAVVAEESSSKENQDIVVATPLKDDPRYKKYFKMLRIGIQEKQVMFKMETDGVDPKILSMDPLGPAPPLIEN